MSQLRGGPSDGGMIEQAVVVPCGCESGRRNGHGEEASVRRLEPVAVGRAGRVEDQSGRATQRRRAVGRSDIGAGHDQDEVGVLVAVPRHIAVRHGRRDIGEWKPSTVLRRSKIPKNCPNAWVPEPACDWDRRGRRL